MFDKSADNPPIPPFLRFVTAIECCVVFGAAALLFFLPDLAAKWWPWTIPPFNSRFVGAIYFAAYIPLIIFWSNARWTPGRMVLWMIFAFTTLVMVVMVIHWDAFAWDRPSTYLVFWPLYIFLPINSAIFLIKSRRVQLLDGLPTPALWRVVLSIFAFIGGVYGVGLLILPGAFTNFWPWGVDTFHAHIYASAFITPAVAGWILSRKDGTASEYLTFGLHLVGGGFLPVVGTLWTNMNVPIERQVNFNAFGTWAFFFILLVAGILGVAAIGRAVQISRITAGIKTI